ncbi:MAG: hypothetical protein ACLTGJ_08370 [Faecalibacterium prausnitzii]
MSGWHSCRMVPHTQLVVGYLAAQGDSYLAVYSYENGTVNAILEQSYEQYLVEDITGGGNEDLILMSTLEDGGVQIELLTVDRDGMFQQVAVMGLSADKFSGCAAVAAGLRSGRQALSGAGRLDRPFGQQSGHGAALF